MPQQRKKEERERPRGERDIYCACAVKFSLFREAMDNFFLMILHTAKKRSNFQQKRKLLLKRKVRFMTPPMVL